MNPWAADTTLSLAWLALCGLMSIGPGLVAVHRVTGAPVDRLLAAVVCSLLFTYLLGWGIFVSGAPWGCAWAWPVVSLASLIAHRRTLRLIWADPPARATLIAQGLVTAWSLGWLALVRSYSGGGWWGDWFGHWQRTVFFLERAPFDTLFNGFDPVPSRPPLVNVIVATWLAVGKEEFAWYQLAMTWFSSLAFLPLAALASRTAAAGAADGSAAVGAVSRAALLTTASPLWLQNATFCWTKLPAALFVLTALMWLLQTFRERSLPAAAALAAALAAAILAHYSAGPFAVVVVLAWLASGRQPRTAMQRRAWVAHTATAAGVGAAILATWFVYALAVYGWRGTLLSNSSVTDAAGTSADQAMAVLLNLRDSIVPHFLRRVDWGPFAQQSPWGRLRDWCFLLYQVNILFAFGSAAWLAVLAAARAASRPLPTPARRIWAVAVIATAALGIAVHSGRDEFGLVHICLQPLVLAGLALVAARWNELPTWVRLATVIGGAVDMVLGILLQFGIESFLIDRWFAHPRPFAEIIAGYSRPTLLNLRSKLVHEYMFLGDLWAGLEIPILMCLTTIFCAVLWRAIDGPRHRAGRASPDRFSSAPPEA